MEQRSCASSGSRNQLLEDLLWFKDDLSRIREQLTKFPWDGVEEATLKASHIRSVLERFIREELSASQVEDWANMIEGRDDVAYDETTRAALKELIFELANPVLSESSSLSKARDFLLQLNRTDRTQ